jgi:hypothetical protein
MVFEKFPANQEIFHPGLLNVEHHVGAEKMRKGSVE